MAVGAVHVRPFGGALVLASAVCAVSVDVLRADALALVHAMTGMLRDVMSILGAVSATSGTSEEVNEWAGFWPAFLGGTAGAGVTAIVTLLVFFLTASAGKRKEREEILQHFLDLVTQLSEKSLAGGAMDTSLFFRANDALVRLTRTSLAPRKPMYNWALNSLMAIMWFDNLATISAARTGYTAHLFSWARNPWSLRERKHFLTRVIPHAQGKPRGTFTWVDGSSYVEK